MTGAILNSLTDQIVVLDAAGVILSVNNSWRDFALANLPATGAFPRGIEIGDNLLAVFEPRPGYALDELTVRGLRGGPCVIENQRERITELVLGDTGPVIRVGAPTLAMAWIRWRSAYGPFHRSGDCLPGCLSYACEVTDAAWSLGNAFQDFGGKGRLDLDDSHVVSCESARQFCGTAGVIRYNETSQTTMLAFIGKHLHPRVFDVWDGGENIS